MIITCPNCQTKYQVTYEAIGSVGRKVQCAHCQQAWQQRPVDKSDATEFVTAFRALGFIIKVDKIQDLHNKIAEPPVLMQFNSRITRSRTRGDATPAESIQEMPGNGTAQETVPYLKPPL